MEFNKFNIGIDFSKSIEDKERERIESAILNASPTITVDTTKINGEPVTCKAEEPEKPQEKWIWVEGYKGTNKDMQGHGNYQFEIGKRYDMPLDVEIKDCHSGFHLSLNMKDVTNHYPIGNGNRFFKVRALVRERDFDVYGKKISGSWFGFSVKDKLASQSIKFIRELTMDEIFQDTDYANWSDEYKQLAMTEGVNNVEKLIATDELVELGYSRPFASYVVKKDRVEIAKAVASQPDLSMDMKALMIMNW